MYNEDENLLIPNARLENGEPGVMQAYAQQSIESPGVELADFA